MEKLILIVLDGWALREEEEGNAIKLGKTPNFDSIIREYPNTKLKASGEAVGLPKGTLGGSEVGHLHLGAGRIIKQKLKEINESIENRNFFEKSELKNVINKAKNNDTNLHLMGLLSDGGVHSHIKHLFALLELCKKEGLKQEQVKIHCFLDGRDTPPKSARKYLKELKEKINEIGIGKISTISGRYYSMDRDERWERTEKAYKTIVYGKGIKEKNASQALNRRYKNGETDEFVTPTAVNDYKGIEDGDGIVLFNFRADRARQITRAFIDTNFNKFQVKNFKNLSFVSMTQYSKELNTKVVFPPAYVEDTLGEVLSKQGLNQLRIAETEKKAHVTYFFNGQRERTFQKEDRIIIPSPKVSTYDKKPEMSAYKIKDRVCEEIEKEKYDFILINFANGDMVGHTGVLKAAIKGVESVDKCLGEILKKSKENGYSVIVTADHGNCDKMLDEKEDPHTAHTFGGVPFVIVNNNKFDLKEGGLSNVAPTAFEIMGIEKPEEMGDNLFKQFH